MLERIDRPQLVTDHAGLADTIRENLARIEAFSPLIPLPLAEHHVAAAGLSGVTLQAGPHITIPTETPTTRAHEVPAPKSLLAPGGRIPVAKPRTPRR